MERQWQFERKRMDEPTFYKCLLAGAEFVEVNFSEARFNRVNLSGVEIDQANLFGVDDVDLAMLQCARPACLGRRAPQIGDGAVVTPGAGGPDPGADNPGSDARGAALEREAPHRKHRQERSSRPQIHGLACGALRRR